MEENTYILIVNADTWKAAAFDGVKWNTLVVQNEILHRKLFRRTSLAF